MQTQKGLHFTFHDYVLDDDVLHLYRKVCMEDSKVST